MTAPSDAPARRGPDTTRAVARLIEFHETGSAPPGLFAPDVFADVSLVRWRVQAGSADELVRLRRQSHPAPGKVRVQRIEPTEHGFTMEFEERWHDADGHWYCREMIRADVVDDTIVDIAVYCTGDWDDDRRREHAETVRLLRR